MARHPGADCRCIRRGGAAASGRGALRRIDDASRSHRRRWSRHFSPVAICASAQSRRLQQAAEHHRLAHRAGNRDCRRRQRHGHLVMSRAAAEAIALAREAGIGWVGVRRSNHAGPAGLYAEMPAAAGMIGLYAAVANANHMATWGGADLLLGTNPLAIGMPTGNKPLVFDMATSIVAYGTVKKYALRGLAMPEGWFVDAKSGAPITDPAKSGDGLLLPNKGSGLALMIGLLAGVLNGAAFGKDVIDFNADDNSATNTGHCIAAIDIARFVPAKTFVAEVDRHIRDLRASQRLPGVDAIR